MLKRFISKISLTVFACLLVAFGFRFALPEHLAYADATVQVGTAAQLQAAFDNPGSGTTTIELTNDIYFKDSDSQTGAASMLFARQDGNFVLTSVPGETYKLDGSGLTNDAGFMTADAGNSGSLTLTLKDVAIENFSCTGIGSTPGIQIYYGNLIIDAGTTFYKINQTGRLYEDINNGNGDAGGAICVGFSNIDTDSSLTMQGGIIEDCSAPLGGAVMVKPGSTFTMQDDGDPTTPLPEIMGCKATVSQTEAVEDAGDPVNAGCYGGGAICSNGGTVNLYAGKIADCASDFMGGAIALGHNGGVTGTLNMEAMTLTDNSAAFSGGAIDCGTANVNINGNVSMNQNSAAYWGGAIFIGNQDISATTGPAPSAISDFSKFALSSSASLSFSDNQTTANFPQYQDFSAYPGNPANYQGTVSSISVDFPYDDGADSTVAKLQRLAFNNYDIGAKLSDAPFLTLYPNNPATGAQAKLAILEGTKISPSDVCMQTYLNPTYSGHIFDGWYTTSDLSTGKIGFPYTMPDQTVNWYAGYSEVEVPLTYQFTLTPETVDFGTLQTGYQTSPNTTFTITNTGTGTLSDIKASLDDANFSLDSSTMETSLAPGKTTSFELAPKLGLKAGTYDTTIAATADNSAAGSATASFTVKASPVNPPVNHPSDIPANHPSTTMGGSTSPSKTHPANTSLPQTGSSVFLQSLAGCLFLAGSCYVMISRRLQSKRQQRHSPKHSR
jgi:hypothetical protein